MRKLIAENAGARCDDDTVYDFLCKSEQLSDRSAQFPLTTHLRI